MRMPRAAGRPVRALLLIVLAVGVVAAGCGSSIPVGQTSPNGQATPRSALPRWAKMGSPEYGVHVFLWGNAPTTERDLKLARDAGFGWVKQRFEWRYIESKAKGQFEWNESDRIVAAANKAGLKIIARIDNQPKWARSDKIFPATGPPDKMEDFADYVSALVGRYKGRVQAYEIWNEPNLAREWGNKQPNAGEYVNMLKAAYSAAKKADPDALIISAGLSPTTASGAIATPDVEFLNQMYAAGAKDYFDLLGVHAAGFKAPPETSPDEIAQNPKYNHGEPGAGRIYGFRHAEDLRDVMVQNGDSEKQVAVLEFGWTSDDRPGSPYAWHSVTEQEKGDYLVRAFKYAKENWRPWIGVMSAIYIPEPAWTKNHEQYYWSITNPDGTTRPAYDAIKAMPK